MAAATRRWRWHNVGMTVHRQGWHQMRMMLRLAARPRRHGK
jgi:hypothetical protein